jgi:hypothetical protein
MAYTDREDLNYLGILYNIGANQTPFLNMAGGLNTGEQGREFQFPLAQPWALSSASQNTQSEATSRAAGTPVTYTRAQDKNTIQIMKYDAEVTYAKQSTWGNISGLSQIGGPDQPVKDELAFQQEAALKQMAIDVEYSFLQGSYTVPSVASTNQQTRGIIEACSTNAVAAGSVDLSKALIDELLRDMAGNGSVFSNPVLFCNAFQKQQLSDIYGFAPTDRTVGGVNVETIVTDFARLGVVYAPQMPTSTVLIADMSVVMPHFVPANGGLITWTDLSEPGASKGGFYYTQIGLQYGPEEYHGKITGLTTS